MFLGIGLTIVDPVKPVGGGGAPAVDNILLEDETSNLLLEDETSLLLLES